MGDLLVLAGILVGIAWLCASRLWWLAVAPVVLLDLAAVVAVVSSALEGPAKSWEDPLPDYGPLLYTVVGVWISLGAFSGWAVRLHRLEHHRYAASLGVLGILPVVGVLALIYLAE